MSRLASRILPATLVALVGAAAIVYAATRRDPAAGARSTASWGALGSAASHGRIYALEGGPRPGLAYSGALEFLDLDR